MVDIHDFVAFSAEFLAMAGVSTVDLTADISGNGRKRGKFRKSVEEKWEVDLSRTLCDGERVGAKRELAGMEC